MFRDAATNVTCIPTGLVDQVLVENRPVLVAKIFSNFVLMLGKGTIL